MTTIPCRSVSLVALLLSLIAAWPAGASDPEDKSTPRNGSVRQLLGHWPLAGDSQDHSVGKRHAVVHGAVDWNVAGPGGQPRTAAGFNGRDAYLEVPGSTTLGFNASGVTIAAWVYTDANIDDVPGDIASQYDEKSRGGFHLTLKTNAGVTTNQANFRQLQFGVDSNRASEWADCGRPGQAILAFALAVHDGELYAGTCEPGDGHAGHVYRYGGKTEWIDCGSPAACNAVTAMAVHDKQLYVGVGKYRLAGSALEESKNAALGGGVYRYEGGQKWTDCGKLPGVEAIGGLVVFRGRLYASSLYKPAGFFRYEGGDKWTDCGTPGKRVEALGVYNGFIYATSYDGGHVYRYDGSKWTDCGELGAPGENSQTYSFAVYTGRLFVGTWPSGKVYRFEDVNRWTDVGRLGEELEVMGMLVHNGRLLAGTLPLAEVYEYDGDTTWRRMARLDTTPEVKYRRAWTMAEFGGRVFVSTLPSGRVYSFEAGKNVMWTQPFPSGWHHVAANYSGVMRLYVDGLLVATSGAFDPARYFGESKQPLRIGFGANDYFCGRLHDVRIYNRSLSTEEVVELARRP